MQLLQGAHGFIRNSAVVVGIVGNIPALDAACSGSEVRRYVTYHNGLIVSVGIVMEKLGHAHETRSPFQSSWRQL